MKVVIINGTGGAGKDTFVAMCKDVLGAGLVCNISTVDFVKRVAEFCGWDGTKTPENRKFLSDLKDLLTEWGDIPFKTVVDEIDAWGDYLALNNQWNEGVVFVHCREPKEIEKLVCHYEKSGELDDDKVTTLLIRRGAAENVQQINHADNDVLNYSYDYTIYNDSTLSWLRNEAVVFLRDYLKLDI